MLASVPASSKIANAPEVLSVTVAPDNGAGVVSLTVTAACTSVGHTRFSTRSVEPTEKNGVVDADMVWNSGPTTDPLPAVYVNIPLAPSGTDRTYEPSAPLTVDALPKRTVVPATGAPENWVTRPEIDTVGTGGGPARSIALVTSVGS